ncbi:hypothetical protein [Pedobacter sp. Hv1]|uniref:hypothetical protein n=1 Tax=Pedobacter sp. Hv1 TaxID=1740090 RepID=UPI000B05354B|nr:hypothetical protein [Pedobacter sp. Hv1]
MAKQELKCPHCKEWTVWQGQLHDRCINCNALLEEEKINKLNKLAAKKEAQEAVEQAKIAKQNPIVRKISNYAATLFIGIILSIIAVVVLVAG